MTQCHIPTYEKDKECRCAFCLSKKIDTLTEMYKTISAGIASHQEQRVRQIDQNRKVSQTLDELRELLKDMT